MNNDDCPYTFLAEINTLADRIMLVAVFLLGVAVGYWL